MKRKITLLSAVVVATISLTGVANALRWLGNGYQFNSNSISFFNRLAPQPDFQHKIIYDRFISLLTSVGTWARLDGLYAFPAQDATTAETNLISSSWTLSPTGSPTFSAYSGFTGVTGAGSYLGTGFDPTTGSYNYQQNSASAFIFRGSLGASDLGGYIGYGAQFNETVMVAPAAASNSTFGVNDQSELNVHQFPTTLASMVVNRTSSAGSAISASGSSPTITYAVAGKTLVSGKTIQFLNDGWRANGSTSLIQFAGFGGGLSQWDIGNIQIATQNYLLDLSGDTTTIRPGRVTSIVPPALHSNGTGMTKLQDGRLLAVWYVGDFAACSVTPGLFYAFSSDDGFTWTSPQSILTVPNTDIYQGAVTQLSDGSLILGVYHEHYAAYPCVSGQLSERVGTLKGTLGTGNTVNWGTYAELPITSPAGSQQASGPSNVVQLTNGNLMFPFYDGSNVWVKFSSDKGVTWGNQTLIDVASLGYDPNESNFVVMPDGTLFGCERNDGDSSGGVNTGYWCLTGAADGSSFTTPYQIMGPSTAPKPGMPTLAVDPSGRILFLNRFNNNVSSGWGYHYSTNLGATFTSGYPWLYNVDSTTSFGGGNFVYAICFYDKITVSFECGINNGNNNTTSQYDFTKFNFIGPP